MRLHWGEPNHPTSIVAYTGAILGKEPGHDDLRFIKHRVARWYGLSFGLRGFLGIQVFGETSYPSRIGNHADEH